MALTTAQIMTRCMNSLRMPDTSGSEQYTRVLGILNEVYRDIMAKYNWYWLWKRQIFNTTAKFSSGTITLTADSTFATISAPPTGISLVGRKMIVPGNASDSGAVFRVATHAANSNEVQFDAAYTGQTLASTSFDMYVDEYSFATDCGRILFMSRFGFSNKFEIIKPEEMMNLKQFDTAEGQPMVAALFDFATTGDPTTRRQVMLHPYPDMAYRIEVRYKQKGNAELSGSAVPLIPDEYAQVLIYGTLSRAYPIIQSDQQNGAYFTQLFNDVLNLMVAQQREYEGLPSVVPRDSYRNFYTRNNRLNPSTADLGTLFDRWPTSP